MPVYDLSTQGRNKHLDLHIKALAWFDVIIEFSPFSMNPGDSLSVSWDFIVKTYNEGRLIDRKPFKVTGVSECQTPQVARFARICGKGKAGTVRVYEDLPDLPDV